MTLATGTARFANTRRIVFGIVLASFVLSFFHRTAPAAIASELTREFAINAAVVNLGVFLGAGILQPLVGWVLDRGRALGDAAHAWDNALLLLAGSAAFGALCTLLVRDARPMPQPAA